MKHNTAGSAAGCVLTLNAGSSSIRLALFEAGKPLRRVLEGKIERIGLAGATFTIKQAGGQRAVQPMAAHNHKAAAAVLMDRLEEETGRRALMAVGHRVVHGGSRYAAPQQVTDELIEVLHRMSPFDPEHMPAAIALIEELRRRFPALPQVACFDTGFHRDLPRVAQLLPIPRRLQSQGVRRYGFHGLSYEFLMEELERTAGPAAAHGRVILAHLGNGASMAAVCEGKPVDTSMGFTPASGLPMSTRSGDLDPGLAWYLARTENMGAERFHRMVNRESGLLGVSETSPDMRDLLEREAADSRAAEAVAMFCLHAKKWIGALAAVLGGLDTLVFAGGIGENAPVVRSRICEGLEFLGVELDAKQNKDNAAVISSGSSRGTVRVIRTDEELMIAKAVCRILEGGSR